MKKNRPVVAALLGLGMALLAASCRRAEVVNHCVEHPGECEPCLSNEDCSYSGNPCTETVYCAHVSAPIAVIDIGCDSALEYGWPDPSTCQCEASVCRSGLGREPEP